MPVIVRSDEIVAAPRGEGFSSRALLTPKSTGSDHVALEKLSLAASARTDLALGETALGWLQPLSGGGSLDGCASELSADNIAYLPRGYGGTFAAGPYGAELLLAQVPEAARFDAAVDIGGGKVGTLDWTREPVLQSEHDARKRIYLATPKLVGSEVYKGEMIRYPPGTAAPEHHHEGAEHFQYVVSGSGTALLDGTPHRLEAGDVLYNFEHERHAFINESDADFVFVEFFVPGPCRTVWAADANACAWLPTGADSAGRPPAREIGYHVHGEDSGI